MDIYARVKADCWNLRSDFVSVLMGVNDVWRELHYQNGVELNRFIRTYETLIDETGERFPDVKFMLMKPFILKGLATNEKYEEFLAIKEYAKAIKEIATRKNCTFIPLQEEFDRLAVAYGDEYLLSDGIHPHVVGSKGIADAWLKAFATL